MNLGNPRVCSGDVPGTEPSASDNVGAQARPSERVRGFDQDLIRRLRLLDSLQDSVREVDLELDAASERIEVPGAVRIVRRGPCSWTVTVPAWDVMAWGRLQAQFRGARLSVRALSLEEIFLAYVGGRRE